MRRNFLCRGLLVGLGAVACWLPVVAAPPPEAPAGFPDPLTPADTSVLVTVDFRELLAAPIVKKYVLDELTKGLKRDAAGKLLDAAGINPLKDVETLTVSLTGDVHKPHFTGILRGRFDTDKLQAAFEGYAKDHPDKLTIETEAATKGGDAVPLYRLKGDGGKPRFAALVGKRALVFAADKAEVLLALKAAERTPEGLNKEMKAAVGKVGGKQALSMAVVITQQIKDLIKKQDADSAPLAAALESVTGSLEVTDAVKLVLEVHTTDPEIAKELHKKIDEVIPLANLFAGGKDVGARIAKQAISAIKVSGQKNDVRITLTITEEMIRKASKPDDN